MAMDVTFPTPSTSARPESPPRPQLPYSMPVSRSATFFGKVLSFLRMTPNTQMWIDWWIERPPMSSLHTLELDNMNNLIRKRNVKDKESGEKPPSFRDPSISDSNPSREMAISNTRLATFRGRSWLDQGADLDSDSSDISSENSDDDFQKVIATKRETKAQTFFKYSVRRPMQGKNYQMFSALACSIVVYTSGMQSAWSILMMAKEESGDDGRFHLKSPERSMIGGVFYIAIFFSSPPTGLLMDLIGRKIILLLSALPFVVAWIVAIVATTANHLLISRFMAGLGRGIVDTAAPIYISEISETENRGTLSVLLTVMKFFGMMVQIILVPYVGYTTPIAIGLASTVLSFIVFIFASESPTYYVFKDNRERALEVLARIRIKDSSKVREEYDDMTDCADFMDKVGVGLQNTCGELPHKRAIHMLIILAIVQQFSGILIFDTNAHGLFNRKDSVITLKHATLIFKIAELCGTLLAMLFVDYYGRRLLLFVSCIGIAVCHTVLCIDLTLMSKKWTENVDVCMWIPVFVSPILAVFYGLGLGPLPWTLLGEMFPPALRGSAAFGLCWMTNISGFVTIKLFQESRDYYSLENALWVNAMVCVIGATFVWSIIPENAGRKINDIIDDLENKPL